MPETRRRSPAEKKALSYAKDRRNSYGGNDKAARKAIPARKAGENRKDRRKAGQALESYTTLEEGAADLLESSLINDIERVYGWSWKKSPDQTLGEHIKCQKDRRDFREGRKQWARNKREEAKQKGTIFVSHRWRGSEY